VAVSKIVLFKNCEVARFDTQVSGKISQLVAKDLIS
jgi:hypothetical protein